jgi:hypothetical protein
MQSANIILLGPFSIAFQKTAPLFAPTKKLPLIHASPVLNVRPGL